MKTLEQFKLEHNISKIDLLKGKGRMYAKVGNTDLIVGETTDLAKPLFVIHGSKEDGSKQPFQTLVNSNVTVAASI